jgi:uncharacterized protein YodC (DUF2158 family)
MKGPQVLVFAAGILFMSTVKLQLKAIISDGQPDLLHWKGLPMSIEFKEGDVVRLKSGGPIMTVEKIGEGPYTKESRVWCQWFDDKKQLQEKDFAPNVLQRHIPNSGFAVAGGAR